MLPTHTREILNSVYRNQSEGCSYDTRNEHFLPVSYTTGWTLFQKKRRMGCPETKLAQEIFGDSSGTVKSENKGKKRRGFGSMHAFVPVGGGRQYYAVSGHCTPLQIAMSTVE